MESVNPAEGFDPYAATLPSSATYDDPKPLLRQSAPSTCCQRKCSKVDRPATDFNEFATSLAGGKITLGICCMAKKMKSSTMKALIERFESFGEFTIICFKEAMILDNPVSGWPVVDCMISFFSSGFPLDKAVDYAHLNPQTYHLIDPESQRVLLDRRSFYSALRRNNVPVVEHIFCSRDGFEGAPPATLEENLEGDFIVVNGTRLDKPFVEKPVDSEDHSVRIYYPKGMGGGCTQMMRKVDNKSSEFMPDVVAVRSNGSFIYERYINTADLQDVKCYTVGPNYVHAESRKAPVVDGVVTRDDLGKEVRKEESLSPDELMVARKIIKVFRQMVCGFDILRSTDGGFFVCDVNGWSFVKNNDKYVDYASSIMREIFLEEVCKRGLHRAIIKRSVKRELCGIVGVFRHADRTPKQKCKIEVTHRRLLEIAFEGELEGAKKESGEVIFKTGHPKLRLLAAAIKELVEVATVVSRSPTHVRMPCVSPVVRTRVPSIDGPPPAVPAPAAAVEPQSPFENREPPVVVEDAAASAAAEAQPAPLPTDFQALPEVTERDMTRLKLMLAVLGRANEGLKIQLKPQTFDAEGRCTQALLVCKWGGWLTEAGGSQAEDLGRHFIRRVFGTDASPAYTCPTAVSCSCNNERRVQHTAKALLEQFFNRPGAECSIDVEEELLGETVDVKQATHRAAIEANRILHLERPEEVAAVAHIPGVQMILDCVVLDVAERTPLGALRKLHQLLQQVLDFIPRKATLYRGESVELMRQRWALMAEHFFTAKHNRYDTSKIPEIFDYVSYDVCYNQASLAPLDLYPLFTLAEALNAFAGGAEYGITREEKREIGCLTVAPLLRRILEDLKDIKNGSPTRTRLYFTSESHVVGLYSALYTSEATRFHTLGEPQIMHFLSHFVFKLYRYPPSAVVDASSLSRQNTGACAEGAADGGSMQRSELHQSELQQQGSTGTSWTSDDALDRIGRSQPQPQPLLGESQLSPLASTPLRGVPRAESTDRLTAAEVASITNGGVAGSLYGPVSEELFVPPPRPSGALPSATFATVSPPPGPDSEANSAQARTTPASHFGEHYQLEVHFSNGVDKNMFGIVENHHASYAAVTPMIRIHNNLDLQTFGDLVRGTLREYDAKCARRFSPVSKGLPPSVVFPSAPPPATSSPASNAASPIVYPGSKGRPPLGPDHLKASRATPQPESPVQTEGGGHPHAPKPLPT